MSLGLYCIFVKFFFFCAHGYQTFWTSFICFCLFFFSLYFSALTHSYLFLNHFIQVSFKYLSLLCVCRKCVWLNFALSFLALIVCVDICEYVWSIGLSFIFTLYIMPPPYFDPLLKRHSLNPLNLLCLYKQMAEVTP